MYHGNLLKNIRCEKESLSVRINLTLIALKFKGVLDHFLIGNIQKLLILKLYLRNLMQKLRSGATKLQLIPGIKEYIPKRSKKISKNPSAYLNRNYSVASSTPGSWKDKTLLIVNP